VKSTTLIIVLLLFLVTGLVIGSKMLDAKHSNPIGRDSPTPTSPKETCIPTFQDGGGPYYRPNSPERTEIAPPHTGGITLVVSGKILRNDCKTPVPFATLDIWQANENGEYEDEWYRGVVQTSENGSYKFETVIPKGYGEGTGYRPPHIHFKVFENNREIITSQMFFPESQGEEGFIDAYIMKVEEKTDGDKKVMYGAHDIVLP
jgi:protocatechuate 3,4-dioxygenase beta subunit